MSKITGNSGVEGMPSPVQQQSVKEAEAASVTLSPGFDQQNTVSRDSENVSTLINFDNRKISLPPPTVDVSNTNFVMQEEVDGALGQMNFFPSLIETSSERSENTVDGEAALTPDIATIFSMASNLDDKEMDVFVDQTLDIATRLSAIESAPPEVLEKINGLMGEAADALNFGNIEDVAAILSRVQTELRDTRIKFDSQAIQAAKESRADISQNRIAKLEKALKKMAEAEKKNKILKIFGGIATALAVIVSVTLVATGVLSKAGIALMVASTSLMVAITVSQNTGNWMNKVFGESKEAQMVAGIMWTVIAIALSVGSCAAGSAGQGATAAAQSASKIASMARVAKNVSQVAQGGAKITEGAVEVSAAVDKFEGEKYRSDAMKDLAFQTKMQFFIEDAIESIERAIKEINEGQEIASTTMKAALDSKYSVAKNI